LTLLPEQLFGVRYYPQRTQKTLKIAGFVASFFETTNPEFFRVFGVFCGQNYQTGPTAQAEMAK
jgi:hypothetical protein